MNQKTFTAVILLLTILCTTDRDAPPSSATASHFFPFAKYYLNFQNRLQNSSEVIQLDCSKAVTSPWISKTRGLATQWIKQNQDWGFSFRTNLRNVEYDCSFTCLGRLGEIVAFVDDSDFEDNQCGGRHCTWMFNDDGVFLYHDKDKKYYPKMSFTSGE